jgi:hypothetical protein
LTPRYERLLEFKDSYARQQVWQESLQQENMKFYNYDEVAGDAEGGDDDDDDWTLEYDK